MALYQGIVVMYKTAAGAVPAVTTAHYTTGTVASVDVAVGSANTVDITLITSQTTKLTGVVVAAATTAFGSASAVTTGRVYIPA